MTTPLESEVQQSDGKAAFEHLSRNPKNKRRITSIGSAATQNSVSYGHATSIGTSGGEREWCDVCRSSYSKKSDHVRYRRPCCTKRAKHGLPSLTGTDCPALHEENSPGTPSFFGDHISQLTQTTVVQQHSQQHQHQHQQQQQQQQQQHQQQHSQQQLQQQQNKTSSCIIC